MFILEGLPAIIWAFFWWRLVEDAPKNAKPVKVWRVGQPLGYALGIARSGALPRSAAAAEPHAMLVIDDAGLAFRSLPAKSSWPIGVSTRGPPGTPRRSATASSG